MIAQVLLALLSHWRRHPGQLVTLVAGLALATALWTAVQAINSEARASYATASRFLAAGQAGTLTAPGGTVPLADYVALRRAGWQVSPVLEDGMNVNATRILVMGVDILSYPALIASTLGGATVSPTELLLPPGRLLAAPDTAATLAGAAGLPPVIEAEWVPAGMAVTDIGTAETLLGTRGVLSRLILLEAQPMGLPPLVDIAPGLTLRPPEALADTAGLSRSFHLNLTAFGLLSFAVGLFIVQGTIGLAFEQRRNTMRTLRALGVPTRVLGTAMLGELLVFGLVAGLLGVALGYVVAAALLPNVAATLRGLYDAQVAGGLALRPGWVAAGLAMSLTGVLVAGAHVLWRVRRLPILALTGAEAWRGQSARGMAVQTGAGLALILAGATAVWIWDGLLPGFAFLGGLMLGASLLLTPALSLILHFAASRARTPLAQWIWSDMRAQLPGLSLALMALLLALATNVGVGTMVSSFRLTFTGWLDQRLSADLYVTANDAGQTARMRDWLDGRAEAVLPVRSVETVLAGRPGRLYAMVDDPVYRTTWPIVRGAPDLWQRMAEGTGVMVNEQLARRTGLWPGQRIELAPGWSEEVVGVYADYGNPDGQAVVAQDTLLQHFPDTPDLRLAIRVDRPAPLARALRNTFDLPGDAVVFQYDIKARSLEIFERTFLITGALNILTLGVASFAILTSLLTLWSLRLPHLAPAWALGMTRAQLARLEVLRSLALAALTCLAALPLGLILAWALLAVIQVEAFGWKLPMFLFPGDWLVLFVLALLAAGLAALIPALRLYRIPPSGLLKVFADAR